MEWLLGRLWATEDNETALSRKMMEGNTADQLKEVLLKNPHNGNWEALTTSWKSVLH
ncbi:hypothetical protein Tco_0573759, partial [Tanacetum coccineum]